MEKIVPLHKLELESFNNLTKTLSFNIYDVCFARNAREQREYIAYIDDEYNAARLTRMLQDVAEIIGANILNIAHQDYDPDGASVTMLISELPISREPANPEEPGPRHPMPDAVVAHLDKSHMTVHTYPESNPVNGISTFRADIDVSTCGKISPLRALNFLINNFDSDIVIVDYRVRGFTRDIDGKKHYIDHMINSIQNFIDVDTLERYHAIDVNVYQENMFHTKMMLKEFKLDDYLFASDECDLEPGEKQRGIERLKHEMLEIFHGRNID